jgi:hypothetical protein
MDDALESTFWYICVWHCIRDNHENKRLLRISGFTVILKGILSQEVLVKSLGKQPWMSRDTIKMVPAMSGDRSKCHPEKTLFFEEWHFDLSPDMKGTIFYIVPKNPHHAQQGNWVRRPFLIGSWDWRRWGTDDETNFPRWLCGWVCKMFVF